MKYLESLIYSAELVGAPWSRSTLFPPYGTQVSHVKLNNSVEFSFKTLHLAITRSNYE